MSMIERLGLRYCRDYLTSALIVYNGRPALILTVGERDVPIEYVDAAGGNDLLPHSFFTGWKVFAYPELGYRRAGNNLWHVHRSQSAYRGLRSNTLTFEHTPMSYLLHNSERTQLVRNISGHVKLACVMLPEYDTAASLDALLRGELVGVVPNQNICVEPALDGDYYTVLYRTKIVGRMDNQKNFHIDNPAVAAEVRAAFAEV